MAKRKGTMVLGSSAVLLGGMLTACGSTRATPDYAGVCRDEQTGKRLPDSECDDNHHHPHSTWVYYRSGTRVPAVNAPLTGPYSPTTPTNGTYTRGGFSSGGGTVSGGSFADGTTVNNANGSRAGSMTRGGFGSSHFGSGG